jgi:branched-chain amino acid transport system substrate-binding protein
MNFTSRLTAAGFCASLAMAAPTAFAENMPGVTDDEIVIGNIVPYSGPASAYGQVGSSAKAYFDMLNDQGGINGRKIRFITYDDGYSPPKTKEQARKLVERDDVLLLVGTLGTPTNSAIHKYMNQKAVPHLFVSTGASKWGQPDEYPWTMGWQPTYRSEGIIFARYVLENIPDAKIGILHQNDDYGADYVDGLEIGLGDKADDLIIARESFEVTDPTIDSQVIKLASTDANVFYNVTTPKSAAQAIRKAYDVGWENTHLLNSVSNSVGAVMEPAGLEKGEGVISLFYLMDPTDPQWQGTEDYAAWSKMMDEYLPEGDKTSWLNVQGPSIAQTLEHVLRRAGDDLSRENIMAIAADLDDYRPMMLLPGITLNTSETDFYPMEQMQLARFENGGWALFGDVIDGSVGPEG